MRTSNPILNDNAFEGSRGFSTTGAGTMTLQGAVNKTLALLFLVVLSASWVWSKMMQPAGYDALEAAGAPAQIPAFVSGAMMVGVFGGLIAAIVTAFKKEWSPVTAPIYALLEGLFLGGISAFFEMRYPGIVMQAIALTFGTLFCLLMAYKSGMIRATENFKLGIFAATGAIAVLYLVTMVLGFFHVQVPFIFDSGPIGIAFSLFVVVIAALNLVLDFDFIEKGSQMGLPKYMEWFAAFGLIVTLVWLYLEILRLLAKLNDRR